MNSNVYELLLFIKIAYKLPLKTLGDVLNIIILYIGCANAVTWKRLTIIGRRRLVGREASLLILYSTEEYCCRFFSLSLSKRKYNCILTRKTVFPNQRIADSTQNIPSTIFRGMRNTLNAKRRASNLCTSDTPSIFMHPDWFR